MKNFMLTKLTKIKIYNFIFYFNKPPHRKNSLASSLHPPKAPTWEMVSHGLLLTHVKKSPKLKQQLHSVALAFATASLRYFWNGKFQMCWIISPKNQIKKVRGNDSTHLKLSISKVTTLADADADADEGDEVICLLDSSRFFHACDMVQ